MRRFSGAEVRPAFEWKPRSRPQALALSCPAQMTLFGGSAGALKTATLLVDAIRERDNPRMRALICRQSFPELERNNILQSRELYPHFGATYHETKHLWTFPSGATVEFGHIESDKHVYKYQGAEYSFIGFDESTHHTEFQIRYMLSRLRTTDPDLFPRMRLATNPGGVGASFHRAMFMGPTCTHCQIVEGSRHPYVIYDDAVWPSDGRPVGKTTAFIPGKIADHDLFDDDYRQNLESQSGAIRAALLEGCWAAFEGQYFDIWNEGKMVVPHVEIDAQPHWHRWAAIDFGFGNSSASAHLFTRSTPTPGQPNGVTYIIDEYVTKGQSAEDFGRTLARKWGSDSRFRVQAWFIGRDARQNRGTGYTIAGQIEDGGHIPLTDANDDRAGRAQLMYSMLENGELLISSRCTELIKALQSRLHDPDRSAVVLKVSGDPLDDVYDSASYGVASWGRSHVTDPDEFLRTHLTASDMTARHLQHLHIMEQLRQQNEPQSYLGRGIHPFLGSRRLM